jgi:hypothetical protein
MGDGLTCWICRKPIHRLEKRIQAERGVYHRTCWPGVYGGMHRDYLWAATGGYPPFLIEDQAALLMKGYYWKNGLRRAVMRCRACEVVLFDRDGMAEFRPEHAEHDIVEQG